jgi:tRNA(Ile)-lysidine synthase
VVGVSGPDPAVAVVRAAVRVDLRGLLGDETGSPVRPLVLVACSGGADSLALAAATAWVAPRLGARAGAVVVDHGWTADSPRVAGAAADACRSLGLAPVQVVAVALIGRGGSVAPSGRGGPVAPSGRGGQVAPSGRGGPEAAARDSRYAALEQAAARTGAVAVLVGHTADDQAETVLLGLARGSGTRSLAGMAPVRGLVRRPLLGLRRTDTRACCTALGLVPAEDPANADPRFTRSRVRHRVLPVLEAELGPGVAAALARTARAARDDADALDALAGDLGAALTGADGSLGCAELAAAPAALRRRLLRAAAVAAGSPAADTGAGHVDALDRLLLDWHGQDGVDLPGGLRAIRAAGRLVIGRGPGAGPRAGRRDGGGSPSV